LSDQPKTRTDRWGWPTQNNKYIWLEFWTIHIQLVWKNSESPLDQTVLCYF